MTKLVYARRRACHSLSRNQDESDNEPDQPGLHGVPGRSRSEICWRGRRRRQRDVFRRGRGSERAGSTIARHLVQGGPSNQRNRLELVVLQGHAGNGVLCARGLAAVAPRARGEPEDRSLEHGRLAGRTCLDSDGRCRVWGRRVGSLSPCQYYMSSVAPVRVPGACLPLRRSSGARRLAAQTRTRSRADSAWRCGRWIESSPRTSPWTSSSLCVGCQRIYYAIIMFDACVTYRSVRRGRSPQRQP